MANSMLHASVAHGTWSWYMKKIHPAIMEECTRTDWQTDWRMDWTLSYIPQFHLGGVGNNNSIIVKAPRNAVLFWQTHTSAALTVIGMNNPTKSHVHYIYIYEQSIITWSLLSKDAQILAFDSYIYIAEHITKIMNVFTSTSGWLPPA